MFAAFDRRFVLAGEKLGVSPELLLHTVRFRRILSAPVTWLHRLSEARKIRSSSKYARLIDEQKGYFRFGAEDFPGIAEAVEAANLIFEQKYRGANHDQSKKPFFSNLVQQSDLEQHPELERLARSRPMLEAAAGYLGVLPTLRAIGIYYSPANDTLKSSQMYHTDGVDLRQVKCFINIHEVGPDNGPFTFIVASKSEEIRAALNHRWRDDRLEDEEVLAHCGPDDVVSLVGGPGSGALVDSCRCLHFGSRCRVGYRLVLMFQYTRYPDAAVKKEKYHLQGTALLLGADHG